MIELYDIVEAASQFLKEGTLILHRNIKVHTKFKVYKIYCYDLYLIKGKVKTLLSSSEYVKNAPADEMMKIWEECDKLYLSELIRYITGEEYKSLIDGI